MTAGEYGTPTHYLKGKDIKTKGDCLVYCYTRKIEFFISTTRSGKFFAHNIPEGFEKW